MTGVSSDYGQAPFVSSLFLYCSKTGQKTSSFLIELITDCGHLNVFCRNNILFSMTYAAFCSQILFLSLGFVFVNSKEENLKPLHLLKLMLLTYLFWTICCTSSSFISKDRYRISLSFWCMTKYTKNSICTAHISIVPSLTFSHAISSLIAVCVTTDECAGETCDYITSTERNCGRNGRLHLSGTFSLRSLNFESAWKNTKVHSTHRGPRARVQLRYPWLAAENINIVRVLFFHA